NLLGQVIPEAPEGHRDFGDGLTEAAKDSFFDPGSYEILSQVSTPERRILAPMSGKAKARIGLVDRGVKWNIIRQLLELGCEVELVPWNARLDDVDCSAWLISNGPGDPTKTGDLQERVRGLFSGARPVLGICLGHQILSLAAGATTRRMQYGHRSHNQPVYQVGTRRGYITSQNHGYVVEEESLP